MWIVNTKTDSDKRSVEVSAVIKGSHGDTSWGWHDNEKKVVILRVEKLYQQIPVSDAIIEQAQKEAQEICDKFNTALLTTESLKESDPEEESLKAVMFRRMESLTKYPINNDHKLYEKTMYTAQIVGIDPKSVKIAAFMFFFAVFDGKITDLPLSEKTLLMIGIAKCMFDLWVNQVNTPDKFDSLYHEIVRQHIVDGSITKETADKYFFGIDEQYVIRNFINYVIDNLKE